MALVVIPFAYFWYEADDVEKRQWPTAIKWTLGSVLLTLAFTLFGYFVPLNISTTDIPGAFCPLVSVSACLYVCVCVGVGGC